MQLIHTLSLLFAAASAVEGFQSPHRLAKKHEQRSAPVFTKDAPEKRSTDQFLTKKTQKYAVDGKSLPQVNFNIGESYAGTLPISSNIHDHNQLWFWFFPSTNPKAKKEIAIWLNGGPGCSSLDGLFQENGPFTWQTGTYEPIVNPYAWTNLTNMVYIDQPVSTGFSPGNISVTNEVDVSTQFAGFWKNFITLFDMQGYSIYINGESYAGQYIPYIAGHFLDLKDTTYYNVKGVQIIDPSINHDDAIIQAPSVPAMLKYNNVIGLNESFVASITAQAKKCGYIDFMNKWTTEFPPSGKIPTAPSSNQPGCDVYDALYAAIYDVNPCFNIYHLTDFCPYLWDEMGFPSLGWGPNNYFNNSAVQKAIHAPPTDYAVCGGGPNLFPEPAFDTSLPSALGPLPSVIDRTNNVILSHGLLDFLLFSDGSLVTIQNMTWNGKQGFQTAPSATKNLFVPYHSSLDLIESEVNSAIASQVIPVTDVAGAGYQGTWHTERGFTFTTLTLAGHEIPQYAPGAAYRQFEFLLGRIPNLSTRGDYTTRGGGAAAPASAGKGFIGMKGRQGMPKAGWGKMK